MSAQSTSQSTSSPTGAELAAADDAPSLAWYSGNNDFSNDGESVADTLSEAEFDLRTHGRSFLILRQDLSYEEALKELENLRWLVERSFERTETKNPRQQTP